MVFHVLNRGVARLQLFEKAGDYQAFEQVLRDTLDQSLPRSIQVVSGGERRAFLVCGPIR
jgi:hypothetical protein